MALIGTPRAVDGTPVGSLSEVVDRSSVLVCCGSGGVGKTTTAAVIGLEAARRGRRVVVVTIDPARRLADALGLADGLTGEPQRVTVDDRSGSGELWAMMLDTPAMFERVVRANAPDPGPGRPDRREPFLPQHRRRPQRHPGVHGVGGAPRVAR